MLRHAQNAPGNLMKLNYSRISSHCFDFAPRDEDGVSNQLEVCALQLHFEFNQRGLSIQQLPC
eukprot:3564569-Amphidinium_carterae.1